MLPPGFSIDPVSDERDHALARKQLLGAAQALPTAQYVAFRGLVVVQSATEARHVRYNMELASAELQLHLYVSQRYSAFFALRKRLLRALTKCQDELARPTLVTRDLRPAVLQPCCKGCRDVRRAIKRAPFPRRAFVFTTAEDVDARAPLLEGFLDTCVRLLVDWQGCARGRKFACVVLGQFCSYNLLFHVFQQLRLTLMEQATAQQDAQDTAQRVERVPGAPEREETQESAPTTSI